MYENLNELKTRFVKGGTLEWIGIRSEKFAELTSVSQVEINTETGITADHYSGRSRKRQITLIQKEHLAAVASYLGKEQVVPGTVRRNILTSGINLLALIGKKVRIGATVILEITGHCHPCSRMEKNLGKGGYNAMRGHGGVTAKVIHGGFVNIADELNYLDENTESKTTNNK